MICNMIHNSDTSQPGGLTLPDESEVLGWGQLDFGYRLADSDGLEYGDMESGVYSGETIGAFMTATNTTYDGAAQTGRCVFAKIKTVQNDADYPDRLILPFLIRDTVYLVEVYPFVSNSSMNVQFTVVAEVGTLADSVKDGNYIVYKPTLYAK